MNRHSILFKIGLIVSFMAIAIVVAGCSDDKTTEPETAPPDLPPLSSLVMTFDDFQSSQQNISAMAFTDVDSTGNWGRAALTVFVWNVALTVTLIVPVAAFAESFQHEPVRQTDGSWNGPYIFTAAGAIHTAVLNGRIDGDAIIWSMRISKQDAFADFLWFTGSHDLMATDGTWTLNHEPTDPTPFLGIEWHRNPATNTGDLKYTNIIPGSDENGGYIFYGSTTGTTYDRFYDIFSNASDNHINIEWHHTTKIGRIQDEAFYGDADWRCWNSTQVNDDCP